jgi:nitrous oxidase accessory protein
MRFISYLVFFISFYTNANTITVCHSCKVTSIKKAVLVAKSGDTILVKKGVYKESSIILINKELHLVGEGNPIVDGDNKETIFKINSDNFSIEGFTIINVGQSYTKDYAAILVSKSKYFTIKNNILKDVFFGILIEKSHYGTIENNTVTSNAITEANSGNGIHLWHSSHMRINNNKVSGLRDGIYFEFVSNSSVTNNISKENVRYGLHFMFSNHNEYHHNDFNNNGAGVAVMFSKYIRMHHNTFRYNWGTASYGLLLKEIYDAQIENNYFEQNTIGINVDGCTRIDYTNNHFVRNGWAVKFNGGCYKNIFEYNNFIHNAFDLSYNSKLNNNRFEGNYWSEYTGYDLDKDGIGDVAHRPVKLFSYIVSKTPESLVLLRSLFIDIINFSEKVSPVFTPDNLVDLKPIMKKIDDRN